jgi:hypothetical protein
MEPDEHLLAKLRVLKEACAHNREAFIEALRARRDVSQVVAEARSLESAATEIVKALRERHTASA